MPTTTAWVDGTAKQYACHWPHVPGACYCCGLFDSRTQCRDKAADGFPVFFAGGGPTRALSVAFGGPALGGDGVRPLESPSRGGNSPR